MPKVGTKLYPYSAKGTAAAKKEAAKTGMPMEMHKEMPADMKKKHKKMM